MQRYGKFLPPGSTNSVCFRRRCSSPNRKQRCQPRKPSFLQSTTKYYYWKRHVRLLFWEVGLRRRFVPSLQRGELFFDRWGVFLWEIWEKEFKIPELEMAASWLWSSKVVKKINIFFVFHFVFYLYFCMDLSLGLMGQHYWRN